LIRATLALAGTPILVVRPNSETALGESISYREIMVPLDGSQRAECVLPLAAALARTSGAQLLLAHVISRPEMPRRMPTSEDEELAERVVERNREESERYLEQLRTRYAVNTATRILVDDNVPAALHNLAQQENVDLVVLCAHGYSGEPRWPFGSIANNLINYYDKSMVIVQDLPADLPSEDNQAPRKRSGAPYP
ncbi:MAG: universal stress protein, partial [Chloroflexi bacterium]